MNYCIDFGIPSFVGPGFRHSPAKAGSDNGSIPNAVSAYVQGISVRDRVESPEREGFVWKADLEREPDRQY
jgi:hypothetical protein